MHRLSRSPIRLANLFLSPVALVGFLTFLTASYLATAAPTFVEGRRPLEHEDYDRWQTITQQSISPDGQWVMFAAQSGMPDSDPVLHIRHVDSSREYVISRGASGRFSFDSRFAVYKIEPPQQLLKKLKKEKAEEQDLPAAKLEVLELETGDHHTIDRAESFQLPEENGQWLAYRLLESVDDQTVQQQKSAVTETYEVTPEGLRRPSKEVSLKKRPETSSESATEEPTQKEAEEPTSESQEKQREPQHASGQRQEKESEEDEEEEKKDKKPVGTTLVLRDLSSGRERRFPSVTDYTFSKYGAALAFATSVAADAEEDRKENDEGDKQEQNQSEKVDEEQPQDGVSVFNLKRLELQQVVSGTGSYKQLALNDEGTRLAFVTDRKDQEAETPSWDLYLWNTGRRDAELIASENAQGIPEDWWISATAEPTFAEDNRRLYFSTAPVPEEVLEERREAKEEEEDDDEEEEKPRAKLDIWHWQDSLLQPQQLVEAEEEKERSYRAAYDLQTKKITQLATKEMPAIAIDRRRAADVAVANTDYRYRKQLSWVMPGYHDIYLVNLQTGEREMVREKVQSAARMSPLGKFLIWWDAQEKKWYTMATAGKHEVVEASAGIPFPLEDELHDVPTVPRPYGMAAWLEDDKAVLVYDRYDIWQLDPRGQQPPVCVTNGVGREKTIRFRYRQLDPDLRAIDPQEPLVLTAFAEDSKASGYYRLSFAEASAGDGEENEEGGEPSSELQPLIMLDESLSDLAKAQQAERVIFTRSTFRRFPDIWSSTLDFQTITRISDVNLQQDDYVWGTAELVEWTSGNGESLEGLLYKPDGFNPDEKYPLLVYFYERNADRLHRHYVPAPSRAIINFSFYVSRGYLLFVPDIPYKTGQPGKSAVQAVVPGVEQLVQQGFVDEERIGVQGHSWGGYQVSYIITQTDMFACAEAGAPVSNMTSAYGGIRWRSGMSRMFQYERTQSRIGEDLWAARDKYIANSPLFFVNRIQTPLLILHNDKDGAVPWYQGIELFVAMRRLEKPCWLLNYNDGPHWVDKDENRLDFTIRLQQFFDHYLMDAAEPEWMALGVPAVDKGREFGLELLEPRPQEAVSGEANDGDPADGGTGSASSATAN